MILCSSICIRNHAKSETVRRNKIRPNVEWQYVLWPFYAEPLIKYMFIMRLGICASRIVFLLNTNFAMKLMFLLLPFWSLNQSSLSISWCHVLTPSNQLCYAESEIRREETKKVTKTKHRIELFCKLESTWSLDFYRSRWLYFFFYWIVHRSI